MSVNGLFRTGTSGISIPGTKRDFPEEFRDASRLHFYASVLHTLEVNSTFYKLPLPSTFEKWSADVPDDFQFSIKLWKEITHRKKLEYDPNELDSFLKAIENVGAKKGCLLIQFPATITTQLNPQVIRLLEQIQTSSSWKPCIEFRDPGWYENKNTHEMLERVGASMVFHDMTGSKTPWTEKTNKVIYLRFHGPKGDYRGSYSADVLLEYAQKVKMWLSDGIDVYAYFNNTIGEAFANAKFLQQRVAE